MSSYGDMLMQSLRSKGYNAWKRVDRGYDITHQKDGNFYHHIMIDDTELEFYLNSLNKLTKPVFKSGLDVRGQEKPCFKDGQKVTCTLPGIEQQVIVRGLASQHVIDFWIVELTVHIPGYPWTCISVPHTYLSK